MSHQKLRYFFRVLEVFNVVGFSVGHGVPIQSPRLTPGPRRRIVQTLVGRVELRGWIGKGS